MKNLGKLAVLGTVLAASASFAFADTITLGSFGAAGLGGYQPAVTVDNTAMSYFANETFSNDTTGCSGGNLHCLPAPGPLYGQAGSSFVAVSPTTSYDLDPSTIWDPTYANSSYVGINTEAGPLGNASPQYGYYEYSSSWTELDTDNGTITVQADDTTEVYLTNSAGTVLLASFGTPGGDGHCADGQPNCTENDVISLTGLSGTNTLTFVVEQLGEGGGGGAGDPSGVDFAGTIGGPVPEPSSLLLLGTGLLGAAGMLFRRRRIA